MTSSRKDRGARPRTLRCRCLARHILGLDVMQPPTFRVANTSVNIFRGQEGVWEVMPLNEVCHLEARLP
jgi:broad specificity phosphatase PhoE